LRDSVAIDVALLRGWPLPVPGDGGKDERGRVFVVAGSPQMPGAVILCATAALRAGAGKLQIGTTLSAAPHVAAAVPEALVVALDEKRSGAIARTAAKTIDRHANAADALVIGPGLSDEAESARLIEAVAAGVRVPVVIDAAALGCFARRPKVVAHLRGAAVFTPHAGEMAMMLRRSRDEIEADPQRYAQAAAERFGAVVVLKGAVTYIADPRENTLYRNDRGDAGLATCGSGDVLAGIIGGLVARGTAPLHAAAWGVYLHARAGDALSQRIGLGFLARELPAEVPPLMRELAGSS